MRGQSLALAALVLGSCVLEVAGNISYMESMNREEQAPKPDEDDEKAYEDGPMRNRADEWHTLKAENPFSAVSPKSIKKDEWERLNHDNPFSRVNHDVGSGAAKKARRKKLVFHVEQAAKTLSSKISSKMAQKLYDPSGKAVSIDVAEAQASAGDPSAEAFVEAYKKHKARENNDKVHGYEKYGLH